MYLRLWTENLSNMFQILRFKDKTLERKPSDASGADANGADANGADAS